MLKDPRRNEEKGNEENKLNNIEIQFEEQNGQRIENLQKQNCVGSAGNDPPVITSAQVLQIQTQVLMLFKMKHFIAILDPQYIQILIFRLFFVKRFCEFKSTNAIYLMLILLSFSGSEQH